MIVVAGCASQSSTRPVVTPTSQPASSYNDILPLQHGGVGGVWIEEHAFEDILVGITREKGDLKVEIARLEVERDIARAGEEAARKIGLSAEFRATWLPVLSFIGGAVTAFGISIGAWLLAK